MVTEKDSKDIIKFKELLDNYQVLLMKKNFTFSEMADGRNALIQFAKKLEARELEAMRA